MRAVWTGAVNFGLVNVPVKMYAATEEHDLKGHLAHVQDGGRIRYHKVCEACGEQVHTADLGKVFEVDGQTALLTNEDLAELPSETNKVIDVVEFVPAGEVDPILLDKPYYLNAEGSVRPYALLARTLSDADKVAIVRVTLRSKEHLAVLRVTGKNEVLTLQTLRWPDEIREPDFPKLDNKPELSEAELKVAAMLVEELSAPFNPDKHQDTYKVELRALVESKLEPVEVPDDVADLVAKLEASVKPKQAKPDIRTWAKAQGFKISARGRIPKDIVDKYNEGVLA
ncbi:Ku-like dsDNA break-binding protein [Mycobacterium phage Constella]|nr:Ku-like dsDNA break-binding protein [Mycobacterium phage Constella]